ncbi:MAG TPA: spermidine synthase [Acidimicrobiales bacterium]|nr:spermidine synthase [Acidimicrobiales bacterium]
MSARFEELARTPTRMGDITLRRRRDPMLDTDVFEVKLGDEFLMSSLYTASEVALAELALIVAAEGPLDVVVGGLGLGYTASAVLADPRVRSLRVIEALPAVIDWHTRKLLPSDLVDDPRCELVNGDFFALTVSDIGLLDARDEHCHAVIVDIDHSPRRVLDPTHAVFYSLAGLRQLARHLHPGGVFALWSDDPPDPVFTVDVEAVFGSCARHVVTVPNPYSDENGSATIYVATLNP